MVTFIDRDAWIFCGLKNQMENTTNLVLNNFSNLKIIVLFVT